MKWILTAVLLGGLAASSTVEAQEAATATEIDDDTRIGPGDIVEVNVLGSDYLDQKVRVEPDGTIRLPLLGSLAIGGLTRQQAEELISRALEEAEVVEDPEILIFVEDLSGPSTASQADDPQPAAVQSGDIEDEPRIGPGDLLEVQFLGLAQLDRKVRVEPDGSVRLPLLGYLAIAGLTRRQAEERISRALEEGEFVKNPQVSIFVDEYVSRQVRIQGAVEKPGAYSLLRGTRLLDLLLEAGGYSGAGAGASILILRRGGEGPDETLEIDARRLLFQGDSSLDILLRPGDVIVVPEARTARVFVTGAVASPGIVSYSTGQGMTVLQAIITAGGPTNRTRMSKVYVLRQLPDGTQEKIRINVKAIQRGKKEDFVLQENDTLVVGEWFF